MKLRFQRQERRVTLRHKEEPTPSTSTEVPTPYFLDEVAATSGYIPDPTPQIIPNTLKRRRTSISGTSRQKYTTVATGSEKNKRLDSVSESIGMIHYK